MKIVTCHILFVFISTFSIGQKGTFIGVNYNGWLSRNYGEVDFIKRKSSGYAFEFGLAFGEFGNRVYDGKTKDLGRHTYLNGEFSETFFKTKNLGVQLRAEGSFEFDLTSFFKLDVGFFGLFGTYYQHSEYDNYVFNPNGYDKLETFTQKVPRFNMAIGFDIRGVLKINKKNQFVFGCKLPFYILNPNKYNIYKFFDPPLLGMEPVLSLGFRHRLKG